MGIPFSTGHVLALRRFPASSLGPGYTAVWHRDPAGAWEIYADVAPELSCSRFFGAALSRSVETAIALTWSDEWTLEISLPAAELTWRIHLTETWVTRWLNRLMPVLPDAAWRSPTMLHAIEWVAAAALGVGRLRLQGTTPNGHSFLARPRLLWAVSSSSAALGNVDLGAPEPLATPAQLGQFLIPQRGLFVIGAATFARDAGRSLVPARPRSLHGAAPVAAAGRNT